MNKVFDELFKEWKNRHENETDAYCRTTFPKKDNKIPTIETFRNSFSADGFLSDKFNDVLLILKESNTCKDKPEGEYKDMFWFKILF